MTCPKCQSRMVTVDKSGVHIEQCEGCRGIFLDRGELEQIAGAERAYYSQSAPPPYQPEPSHGGHRGGHYGDSPRPFPGGHRDSPRPYGHGYGRGYGDSPGPYGKRRKKSFLEGLFD